MTTLTPYITVSDAVAAIDFYTRAFGAVEESRIEMDGGRVGHCDLAIEGNALMLSDEFPEMGVLSPQTIGGTPFALVLDVADPDALFARAIAAGATEQRPMTDQEYGRSGWLIDPFGHRWSVMCSNESE